MHDIDDAESAAPQGPEERHGRDGPQNEFEIEITADVGAVVGLADGHGEDSIGHHPCDDHVGADGAVVVFLLLGLRDTVLGDFESVSKIAEGFVVAGVDVKLFARHFEFDGVALAGDGSTEVDVDDIVAFGAPSYVVRVAEGVNLEGADVGGEQGEVLGGGGEHVPWVEVEEGHEKVEAYG